MANFIQTVRNNWQHKRIPTIAVVVGLLVAMLVLFVPLTLIMRSGPLGLATSIPLTIFLSTRVRKLAWFWGIDLGREGANRLETQAVDVLPFTLVPRATPKSTTLIELSDERAVFQLKARYYFWSTVLPSAFGTVAFVSLPVTAVYTYISGDFFRGIWSDEALQAMASRSTNVFAFLMIIAVASYFLTRPNVRVIVKPDTIKFGSYRFDRRYVAGLRVGFDDEGETRPSFAVPQHGSTNLKMKYGRWGERMRYMVPAESAEEIVVWANEIIDQVGMAEEFAPTAREGRKMEML